MTCRRVTECTSRRKTVSPSGSEETHVLLRPPLQLFAAAASVMPSVSQDVSMDYVVFLMCYEAVPIDQKEDVMADEIRELNNEDLEGVAGGKVTIRVPFSTTRLRQLIADAENNGESLDWVLQQIDADDQRKWVRREWEKTHRG